MSDAISATNADLRKARGLVVLALEESVEDATRAIALALAVERAQCAFDARRDFAAHIRLVDEVRQMSPAELAARIEEARSSSPAEIVEREGM
jgi:hypothetical protein